jgi:hypothetical protein
LNLSTTDRLHLVASYFYFAGTSYNPTDQKSSKDVGSILQQLREAVSSPPWPSNGPTTGQDATAAAATTKYQPGELFEDIEAVVLVEEDNREGYDPLWIVRGRRKEQS